METVNDITREMRVELDQSWWDIDREKIHDIPDRLDAAYKWMIDGLNSGIVERDECIAKLTSENERLKKMADIADMLASDKAKRIHELSVENARLRAALKPVLDELLYLTMHGMEFDGESCVNAVSEAKRIYNGGEK